MTIDFTIDEKDFLSYQLYAASKSERIRKKRKRNKVTVPLFYGALAVLFIVQDNQPVAAAFLLLGLLWFLFYPKWETRRYVRYYKEYIKETYKNRIGEKMSIELNDNFILAHDEGSESKVQITEIQEVIEIPTLIFIKLKSGEAFVIPKNKIHELPELKAKLKEMTTALNIKYTVDDKWEWK